MPNVAGLLYLIAFALTIFFWVYTLFQIYMCEKRLFALLGLFSPLWTFALGWLNVSKTGARGAMTVWSLIIAATIIGILIEQPAEAMVVIGSYLLIVANPGVLIGLVLSLFDLSKNWKPFFKILLLLVVIALSGLLMVTRDNGIIVGVALTTILTAFIWGWITAARTKLKQTMIIWTLCLLASLVGIVSLTAGTTIACNRQNMAPLNVPSSSRD